MHSVFRMEKKFYATALSYGVLRLGIEGVWCEERGVTWSQYYRWQWKAYETMHEPLFAPSLETLTPSLSVKLGSISVDMYGSCDAAPAKRQFGHCATLKDFTSAERVGVHRPAQGSRDTGAAEIRA